jgi:hypothetical protein
MRSLDFFQFTQSFQPHFGPGVEQASNRNEYQKSSWGVKYSWRIRLTSPPTVSWLSRKCGIFDASQPYRPPWPVTGVPFLFYYRTFNSYPIVFVHKFPNLTNITRKIQINSHFCNRRMLVGSYECIHFHFPWVYNAYTTASANKASILLWFYQLLLQWIPSCGKTLF